MAITTTIDTDVGVPSTYQRITRVEFDAGETNWLVTVEYYASEAARRDGKRPLHTKRVPLPDYRLNPSPLRSFYAALTQCSGTEFLGAAGDEQHEPALFVVADNDPAAIT